MGKLCDVCRDLFLGQKPKESSKYSPYFFHHQEIFALNQADKEDVPYVQSRGLQWQKQNLGIIGSGRNTL